MAIVMATKSKAKAVTAAGVKDCSPSPMRVIMLIGLEEVATCMVGEISVAPAKTATCAGLP